MSRGFVKEPDELPDPVLRDERRERVLTRSGLAALEARLAVAPADGPERKLLASAVRNAVVPAAPADRSEVAFGATVVVSEAGRERRFTLVGEDEIDIAAGRVGIESPLAAALLGAHPGETVTWHRPSGDVLLTIRSVDYDA